MPKASKETASEHETVEGYEGHFQHFDGGWTVGFETYTQDADLSPFFTGLPDDQCQCAHMGYVLKGKVAFRSGDGEEVFEAGDATTSARGTRRFCTPGPRWSSSAPARSSAGR